MTIGRPTGVDDHAPLHVRPSVPTTLTVTTTAAGGSCGSVTNDDGSAFDQIGCGELFGSTSPRSDDALPDLRGGKLHQR